MKNKKLLDALEYVDDCYLDNVDSMEKKRNKSVKWMKWVSMAACLCIIAIVFGTHWDKIFECPRMFEEIITMPTTPTEDEWYGYSTSDRFENLEELLSHLSLNGAHNSRKADSEGNSVNIGVSGIMESRDVVTFGEYTYQINRKEWVVDIYHNVYYDKLETPIFVGTIEVPTEYIFLVKDRLVLVGSYQSGGDEINYEMSTSITVYSLENPQEPDLVDKLTQRGSIVDCYILDEKLNVFTEDGECVCGYSSFDDEKEYIPQLTKRGTVVEWNDLEIAILGEPTRVQYTALSVTDIMTSKIITKRAFYGNIEDIYYGEEWLAFVVGGLNDDKIVHPDIYTFRVSENFEYTGKLSLAAMFHLPEYVKTDNDGRADGVYPSVKAVAKVGDEYRMVGYYQTISEGKNMTKLLIITANMEKGTSNYELVDCSAYPNFSLDEILWEEDRVIISGSVIENFPTNLSPVNRFIFVEFTDDEIVVCENDLVFDHVDGVDMMYGYGSPLGHIRTLIPFGNGIYLRYNDLPNGLDVYDFNDSANPLCLYKSDANTSEDYRLEFENVVYDENTVGVLKVLPNEEGEYRDVTYIWSVYDIDFSKAEPFTVVKEVPYGSGVDVYEDVE